MIPALQNASLKSRTFPAPVGGWNARDPISEIPPTDAIFLDNWWPTTNSVKIRPGHELFATLPADTEPGSPHNVRALLSHNAPGGTKTLFAGLNDGIYDITAGGTISSVASAGTSGEWESVNLSTAGGHFLWVCNGVDKCRYYNGSAWTVLDGSSTPALTGITSTDVTNVSLFKTRLILTKKDSLSFYYLGVNSVAGAAAEFPLGAIFAKGGYLVATATWTRDAGSGPDDYFVALTSEGELAVYAGTDPSNAATWAIQGVYFVGRPVGKRCFCKLYGDLGVLTVNGFFLLSKALNENSNSYGKALSDKISKAWNSYYEVGEGLFGWQATVFPEKSAVVLNMPLRIDHSRNSVITQQFVFNLQNKAWARFIGWPAEVFHVHDKELYFGRHNKVYKAWTGGTDDGQPIDAKVFAGYTYPNGTASCHVQLVRPVFQSSSAQFTVEMGLDVDYKTIGSLSGALSYAASVAVWDTSLWDQARWSGSMTINNWRTVTARVGRAISYKMRIRADNLDLEFNALDMAYIPGGVLG